MAIKATVKTLDGLSDAVKALYKQDGDKFMLDVEPSDGFELVGGGLKTALLKERETVSELRAASEAFKGLDPKAAREALEKVKTMDSWTPSEKAQELADKRGKEVAALKDAEYAPVKKSYEAIRKAYELQLIGKALEDAATKHKFVAPALAPKLFGENVRLEEKDGVFTPVVLDQSGKPLKEINKDGTERAVSIDEFIAAKAKDPIYAPLIAGTKATGTGGNVPSNPKGEETKPYNYASRDQAIENLAAANARAARR